jgi:DNA-binding transcriptional LysR family regulator
LAARDAARRTPEGEAFLAEASAVVQQADRAIGFARALAEGATGRLRLSYVRTMPGGMPEVIVHEYRRQFPCVELTADSGSTGQNVERLGSGELDVAFAHTPIESGGAGGALVSVEIASKPLVVAIPRAHPLS